MVNFHLHITIRNKFLKDGAATPKKKANESISRRMWTVLWFKMQTQWLELFFYKVDGAVFSNRTSRTVARGHWNLF